MYSLWRDRQLLGRFEATGVVTGNQDEVIGFRGILQVDGNDPQLRGVQQQRMFMFPGSPVLQHHFEPSEIGGDPARSSSKTNDDREQRIPRLTDEEARGVPESELLRIEDSNGNPVPTNWLTIWHFRLAKDAKLSSEELARAQGRREWWSISVVHADKWPDREMLEMIEQFNAET